MPSCAAAPRLVASLCCAAVQGCTVTQVSCGWWHTAAVARVPRGRGPSQSCEAATPGGGFRLSGTTLASSSDTVQGLGNGPTTPRATTPTPPPASPSAAPAPATSELQAAPATGHAGTLLAPPSALSQLEEGAANTLRPAGEACSPPLPLLTALSATAQVAASVSHSESNSDLASSSTLQGPGALGPATRQGQGQGQGPVGTLSSSMDLVGDELPGAGTARHRE